MGRCLWCFALPVLALALAAGCFFAAIQVPSNAEAVVRGIVKLGGIPENVLEQITIVDDSAWYDIITKLNLGIAEGYMHGKIKMDPYPFFISLLNDTALGTRRKEGNSQALEYVINAIQAPMTIASWVMNQQSRERSTRVTKMHYDAGNDLYEHMLGPSMAYTCAYYQGGATNLDDAQNAKFDLVLRKLELKPGMKVVDLGCGWGTAAAYMHEKGKADVTGVSLSEQQVKWATANKQKPGLRYIWQDYRDHCENPEHAGTYDRVYSIGMLEHVGFKNHAGFFKCIKKLLKPDGLAVVHTIGEPDFVPMSDAFLDKYIFPGAVIPAMSSLLPALENDFILEDVHNFGYDYAKTLAAWNEKAEDFFRKNPDRYSVEFQRMWHYYLKICEALFELRINQLWHFVLSPRPATRKRIARQL